MYYEMQVMRRKLSILPFLLGIFLYFFFSHSYGFAVEDKIFSGDLWQLASSILYSDQSFLPATRKGIVDTSLPGGSHLTVKGRKVIGVKYTHFNYLDPLASQDKPASTTEIEQKLQVQVRGKIGEKIQVNVDYDDTASPSEQQKISLVYKGEEDEIIQEVALGDLKLALPKTEFTSYSKSLFGVRVKAKWHSFHLMGIGSITKGISEVKTFTGKTTTEEKEILDTGYIKRTYFKIFFDQEEKYPPEIYGPFSYTSGSLEIWIDDQDGTNNTSATWMEVAGLTLDGEVDTYSGWFDLQYPGQDYTVDYTRGVVKFNRSIGENFIIALSYKDSEGARHPESGYYMIMKGQDERYYRYRFWNFYYLGSQKIDRDSFTFQIKDLSGNVVYDWENPEDYPDYEVSVDFDFGIVEIFNPETPISWETYYRPFPEAYPPTSLHRYSLFTQYSHVVEIYLLHPDVVPESERVYVDGKLLKRDEDYIIDYPSGYLSFVDPDVIGPDTKIRVEYEWMPIMGGEATFLGSRFEFRPGENFSLGSTVLSQTASPTRKIPALGMSPASHQVWEADLHLNFKSNLGKLWGGNLPLEVLFAGEISQSNINPNTFGAAMLEDFSSSKVEDSLSLEKDNWKQASKPLAVNDDYQEFRDLISVEEESLEGEKIDSEWSSDELTVLTLNYDFTGASWASVIYSLSTEGKDYSNMKYIELWAKGIPDDMEVYLDIGIVNEDVDDDGKLDTEDKNGDGILNPGEDTGIIMNIPSYVSDEEGIKIGSNNGELDTEDLDRDGVLDTSENFSTYFLSPLYKEELPTGWCKYTIPLEEYQLLTGSRDWNSVKSVVKHVRIWFKGQALSGTIKIARISISGDRWEVNNLKIKGVNNYDDPDFPNPLEDSGFRSYYQQMFGETKTSEGKWLEEPALSISGDTGYIQQTFVSKRNLTDYRKLNFWIYLDTRETEEGNFYIKLGSDVETNYYSLNLPLTSISSGKWIKMEVPFSDLEVAGNPSFAEIKQLRIELASTSPIHIYINDIYLDKVSRKEGGAERYVLKTSWSKYLTLTMEYKKINPPFAVVGASSTNEKLELKKWGANISLFKFLPLSYSGSWQLSTEMETRGTDLSLIEKDKKLKYSHSYQAGFYLEPWPKLTFKGSNVTTDYLSKQPLEKTAEDTYEFSLRYPVPLKYFLLPTSVSCSFQLKKSSKEIENTSITSDITRKGSLSLPFVFSPDFSLRSSYSQSEVNQKINQSAEFPKSRSKELSLLSQASFLGIRSRIELKGACKEEEFSTKNPGKRKLSTSFNLSSSTPFRPYSRFKKIPEFLSSLNYYMTFNLKREGIYEDTSVSPGFFSQLGIRRLHLTDGEEKLWREKRNFTLKQNWRPFSWLDTTFQFGREEEDRVESGTPFQVEVESWPVMRLKFDLNRTPFLVDRVSGRFFSSSNLVVEYIKKTTQKKNISDTISHQWTLNWKGKFKKPENLSLIYSYKSSIQKETPFSESTSQKVFSSTHQLKLTHSTYLPWGKKIPILNRLINFQNKVNLSATLTRELKFKQATSGTLEEDKEKWNLQNSISYKLRDNINMNLGLNLTYYKDKVKAGEDYFSYGGFARIEIVF